MNFLPFLIAKRLCVKKNKKNTVLLISILSKIGISISIFALIVSFSALNGFNILLNKKILSNLPHGIIQLTDKSLLTWQNVIKELQNLPEITYSEPYIVTNGLIVIKNKIKPISIKSFSSLKHLKYHFSFVDHKNSSLEKKYDNNEIILSSYLLKYLSIKKGDWINIFFLNNKNHFIGPRIENFSLKVIGEFESKGMLDEKMAYVSFEFFKKNFYPDNKINTIELYMSDPFNADKIIFNVAKKLNEPMLAYTWIKIYKNIYHDIKKVKVIVYIGLLLLVITSCFSIASISLMTISKKTQEIAILRSMGANNFLIQLIFLYCGLRSIIISNLIGLFLGILTIFNYKRIIFFLEKNFKSHVLLDNNYFLLQINTLDIINIFISTIIIGIVINWYPAYYASKINPSKILREY